jgi:hypothetical protein
MYCLMTTILFVQFMYDKTGVGARMRKYVFVNLGLWHTYKHVSLLTWRKFGPSVMAGLWHNLWPDSIFFTKPRLQTVTEIFTYLRLAYPSFKKELQRAIDADKPGLQSKICLRNIQDLCEYYIPAVSDRKDGCAFGFFALAPVLCP